MDDFTQNMLERAKMRRQKLNSHISEGGMNLRMPLNESNVNVNANENSSLSQSKYSKGRSGRLNQLAASINEWEDDLKHVDLRRKKPDEPRHDRSATFSIRKPEIKTADNNSKTFTKEDTKAVAPKMLASTHQPNKDDTRPQAMETDQSKSDVTKVTKTETKLTESTVTTVITMKTINKNELGEKVLESKAKIVGFSDENVSKPIGLNGSGATKKPSPERTKTNSSPAKKVKLTESNKPRSPRMGTSNLEPSSVLKRAALFETQSVKQQSKAKDPAELSLAERKALFEKNKGRPPVPMPLLGTQALSPKSCLPKSSNNETQPNGVSNLKAKFQQNLIDATNISLEKLQRQKDLEQLKNRWNANKKPEVLLSPPATKSEPIQNEKPVSSPVKAMTAFSPPPPPMPPTTFKPPAVLSSPVTSPLKESSPCYKDSPEALKVVQTIKPIILSPPREGSLYPSLSDIEDSPDSRNQSGDNLYLNMSFGDIIKASRELPSTPVLSDPEVQVMSEMDAVLDAAEQAFSPAKPSFVPSDSFEYTGTQTSGSTTPLVHTVSFYRKQQSSMSTPGHSVDATPKYSSPLISDESDENEKESVKRKISSLMSEVTAQQTVMAQASKMLSVCLANIEFSGSGEQVEGERLLLLAAHKRQACLNEAERLRVEGTLRPKGPQTQQLKDTGDIIISKMSIPLKREALHALAADENMLYFVCLIKSGEQVVATKVVSAYGDHMQGTTLIIPDVLRLEGLYSDFKALVEVYQLTLAREMLPHHVKYHLQGKMEKKERSLLTPVKKKTQSRLVMPAQSPAGPDAIRTSAFQMCGYAVFSLRELSRKQWSLSKVAYTSPLEGTLNMELSSTLKIDNEYRGFLSMFDDVSGLGAWHRRWCLLSGYTISYWRYPDDETKKIPLGSLDLRTIVTENVGLVSRDICARLHTFLLESIRPRTADDVESLVLILNGETARVRHLLSADTRDDRVAWCAAINKALALIRAWNCQQ